jgi:hypothetical protein
MHVQPGHLWKTDFWLGETSQIRGKPHATATLMIPGDHSSNPNQASGRLAARLVQSVRTTIPGHTP